MKYPGIQLLWYSECVIESLVSVLTNQRLSLRKGDYILVHHHQEQVRQQCVNVMKKKQSIKTYKCLLLHHASGPNAVRITFRRYTFKSHTYRTVWFNFSLGWSNSWFCSKETHFSLLLWCQIQTSTLKSKTR